MFTGCIANVLWVFPTLCIAHHVCPTENDYLPLSGSDHPGRQPPLSPDAEAHPPTATEPHPRHLGESPRRHGEPPTQDQRGQGHQG